MIVIPCVRCTSSITANNRATNGHRFVFHSSEVVGSERHYVPGEPGVMPFESVPAPVSPPLPHMQHRNVYLPPAHASPNEYLPTPPLDVADLSPVSSSSPSPVTVSSSMSPFLSPRLRLPEHLLYDGSPIQESGRQVESSPGPPPLIPLAFGMPTEQADQSLKGGDVLFWHHLIRHGEIPGVSDDPRARKGYSNTSSTRKSIVVGR
jgi:hypothetical protein